MGYVGFKELDATSLRLLAAKDAAKKLARILQIKNYREANMHFVLQNWAVFYCADKKNWRKTSR